MQFNLDVVTNKSQCDEELLNYVFSWKIQFFNIPSMKRIKTRVGSDKSKPL